MKVRPIRARTTTSSSPAPFRTPEALKPAKQALLPIALLEGTFGIRGEVKCRPSSAGESLLAAGRVFWLDPQGSAEIVCDGIRLHQGRPLLRFEGVDDATTAQHLIGKHLHVPRADVPLDEGEYLDEDLIGLRLIGADGRDLGRVTGVEHLPAGDYLVVSPKGALVPMVSAFIRSINTPAGTISVSLPEGLLDSSLAEEA